MNGGVGGGGGGEEKVHGWRRGSIDSWQSAITESPRPLYQNEVKYSAFDMEMIAILMQIKLIFTRKVVHLASFWKWGFLELGSCLSMAKILTKTRFFIRLNPELKDLIN